MQEKGRKIGGSSVSLCNEREGHVMAPARRAGVERGRGPVVSARLLHYKASMYLNSCDCVMIPLAGWGER